MKTIKNSMPVETLLEQYPEATKNTLKLVVNYVQKLTGNKPTIWGKDIIGFGEMTYSNTKVKDQPYFKIGLRQANKHITLYLNAYRPDLMTFADDHGINHGMGCFHIKKAHEKLDQINTFITLSLKET